jgi:predicted amidohydrolase YtcJ
MTARADLVLVNGPVFTSDPTRPWVEAVAVRGGRIFAIGTSDEVKAHIGPGTETIDLRGRLLCAGFQDAHVHPISGGLDRIRCDLLEVAERSEGLLAIAAYRAANPDAGWVRGGGWKFDWFPGGLAPAGLLDDLVPDRPAYLQVADGHAGWANSRALALAGINPSTPDPADGRIERNPDGSPQGTLQEGAMDLVERFLPPNTDAELDAGLLGGQRYLLSHGVTAWQDAMVTGEFHQTYVRLAGDGRLQARVRGAHWWERNRGLEQFEDFEVRRRQSVGRYGAGSVKFMLDGVCENFTARMLDPYLDDDGAETGNRGLDFIDPGLLPRLVTEAMRRGFQPHFHALGDGAVRLALDAIAAALEELGETRLRPQLAHIQVVDPRDVPRFAVLGAVANAQPLWACREPAMVDLTIPFLGSERVTHQYPFRDLLRAGARLAMGSDWAVSSADVLAQIDVAVTRRVPGDPGSDPFLPEQAITLEEAFMAFTAGSAYAGFMEGETGTVECGKAADLVVLEADPFTEGTTAGMKVDMTLLGGEPVYER